MSTRREHRWWKERWVAGYQAQIKAPAALKAFIDHRDSSYAAFARRVSSEYAATDGRDKRVSRQMIAFLANGDLTTCTPALAAAIERALDLPEHTLFALVPKSHARRQTVKEHAA